MAEQSLPYRRDSTVSQLGKEAASHAGEGREKGAVGKGELIPAVTEEPPGKQVGCTAPCTCLLCDSCDITSLLCILLALMFTTI